MIYITARRAYGQFASAILLLSALGKLLRPETSLSKLRISIVQYLNTAPLVWGFTHGPRAGKYDLSFTVPSQCAEALRTGEADIAIIPAIEYQRIDDLVILPNLAIASKKQVRSLLLVATKPIAEVRSIALDSSSRSTQALTRILCADAWDIVPRFFEEAPDLPEMLRRADAALLIGDPALRLAITLDGIARRDGLEGRGRLGCPAEAAGVAGAGDLYIYDIVEEWQKTTGWPAVLAVWAGRAAMITEEVLEDFRASRDFGLAHIAQISEVAEQELKLPAAALASYLQRNIDYSLDEENRRGLEHFFARAAALGLISVNREIILGGEARSLRQTVAKS
jgi:chorismate dehydratase